MATSRSSSYTARRTGARTTTSRTGGYRTSSFGRTSSTSTTSTTAGFAPSRYTQVCNTLQQRVGSLRTLWSECKGPGKVTCFSPAAANRWVNFVNSGCGVYKFSTQDCARWFGGSFNQSSNASAFRMMRGKFGTGIVAVARGKNNSWIVAARSSVSARPFTTYNWK